MVFHTAPVALFLSLVLAVAAVGVVLSLRVVVEVAVRNRSTRLARHQSRRTYYGRLALHH
jgi:hypothetical protein